MANGLEPSTTAHHHERGTSASALQLELGIGRPPEPVRASLPPAYGIPLLELLIVDTEYVFVSWEITASQLEQARAELGAAGFEQRQLVLRLSAANAGGNILAEQELYGEAGRWFLRHGQAGKLVTAELGYRHAHSFKQLQTAGPVELPRDTVIEPKQYDELRVRYGVGSTGELVIESTTKPQQATWPDVRLPQPSPQELAARRQPDSAAPVSGMPGSAELGLPSSYWSGGIQQQVGMPPGSEKDGEE